MSLPQHIWDIIRHDPRFKAAGRNAQQLFLGAARKATWDIGHEHIREAASIFMKALDAAFGPHPSIMQTRKRGRK